MAFLCYVARRPSIAEMPELRPCRGAKNSTMVFFLLLRAMGRLKIHVAVISQYFEVVSNRI